MCETVGSRPCFEGEKIRNYFLILSWCLVFVGPESCMNTHVGEERQVGCGVVTAASVLVLMWDLSSLADPVVKEQSQPCAENTVLSSGLTAAR